jgi:hypothetical protein
MEEIIGTLERVSGHTFDTIYDLLFTSERIIALIVRHPLDVSFKFGATELLLGGSLMNRGERPERLRIEEERHLLYKGKSFDELVTDHRHNFEIPYNKVKSVRVSRGLFHSYLKFHVHGPSSAVRKIKFTLAKRSDPDARLLLDQVLSSKIEG